MLTRRAATQLLEQASSLDALAPIARALGFSLPPATLDGQTLLALALPAEVRAARVTPSPGAIRLLLLETTRHRPLHDLVPEIARRLEKNAPHLLWLLLVAAPGRGEVALACWDSSRWPPRVTSLLVRRAHVVDSDAETLCALSAPAGGPDALVHHRWLETLGREGLGRRFYHALRSAIDSLGAGLTVVRRQEHRQELALTTVARLLFLSFIESKGWLDGDPRFLVNALGRRQGRSIHERLLLPLFFGTLNTPVPRRAALARGLGKIPFLNGGLFARTALEKTSKRFRFEDGALVALIDGVLARFRFTAREEAPTFSDTAIDPEMLGRTFESLMAHGQRQETGAYYTPFAIVDRMTDEGLREYLAADGAGRDAIDQLFAAEHEKRDPDGREAHLPALQRLTVLDPACGSGAFLVRMLERLADLRERAGERGAVWELRRRVLATSIYGVDVNPMAVWLCELRLWLSVVIDHETTNAHEIPPLPNLEHAIRVGDSLSPFEPLCTPGASPLLARIARWRSRFAQSTGKRKQQLGEAMNSAYAELTRTHLTVRRRLLDSKRRHWVAYRHNRDLFGERVMLSRADKEERDAVRVESRAIRTHLNALAKGGAVPFHYAVHFPDIFAEGGFGLVIGNPPWVRLHRMPPHQRESWRRDFRVFRDAPWVAGAERANAGRGFSAQVDLAALFAERGLALVRPGGLTALLLPAKLWRSLAGGGLRRLLAEEHELRALEDWSEAPSTFDAAVYPSVVIARRRCAGEIAPPALSMAVHRRQVSVQWSGDRRTLAFDASPGAPWLLLPPDARRAFDRMIAMGQGLSESGLARLTLGVKCGCNEAFVVTADGCANGVVEIASGEERATVPANALRPVLRGEDLRPWRCETRQRIVWTHDDAGRPLSRLPGAVEAWLRRWRPRLENRSDLSTREPWWALHRVDAARPDAPRVVWGDVGRAPRAIVLPADDPTIPLNTCYVARCRDLTDAHTLAALLNSPLARAWLSVVAEPARGGYRRYLAWTVALLPVPRDWGRARATLGALGARACDGEEIGDVLLLDATRRAFHLRDREIASLLEWTARLT